MIKRILSLILVIFTVAALAAGCGGNTDTPTTDSITDPSTDVRNTSAATEEDTEEPYVEEPIEYKDSTEIVLADYKFENVTETGKFEYKGDKEIGPFSYYLHAYSDGTKAVLPQEEVSGIFPLFSMSETTVTQYDFDLHSSHTGSREYNGDMSNWFTFYFGLRLEAEQAMPTEHTGVWIAMRDGQLGLRKTDWPATTYMNGIDFDFSKGEHIRIVDDPETNIIRIYAGADLKELAYIKIDGKKIEMYKPGADRPAITDTVLRNIIKGGHAHLWNHITSTDTTIDNLTVTTIREIGNTDNDGVKPNTRDLLSDTWTATDELGRTVTVEAPAPDGKKVGIFYFLWHETSNNKKPLYDHTAAYEKGGIDELWNTMKSGDLGYVHYWGQPYFGYYASDDEWVIRKHGAMLAEAGIDFVFFDATNGPLYQKSYTAVMRVWSEMRKEGTKTPDVCFILKGGNNSELNTIWGALYEPGLYEDMWFRWNGKPVVMFTQRAGVSMTKEQKDFFTVRYSWAMDKDPWYTELDGYDCWPWATLYPQKGGFVKTEDGNRRMEQMVVMCGFWANGSYGTNAGRSYTFKKGEPKSSSDGPWDMGFGLFHTTSGLGLAYQEQFDRALEFSPDLIMITGWNEWWGGRWEGGSAVGQKVGHEYYVSSNPKDKEYNYYVDNLNPEYSRDIEPMSGGFGDNYYYQTVDNVRKYKGARNVQTAFGQKTVDLSGSITQWFDIGPEYRDAYGDTAHRDHLSHVGGMTYKNDSGRNDIITSKVSYDGEYLYFFAECADDITAPEGENWMNLFINSNGVGTDGWYGFDFVIGREIKDGKASVMKFADGWNFEKTGEADLVRSGKVLQIKVAKSLIGFDGENLDFKWADNSVNDGDVMKFIDMGDTAPDNRFCYRYTLKETEQRAPDCLTKDMIVLKANGYNAFVKGKQVMLVSNSTKATLLASGYDFYLPVSFIERTLRVSCDGQKIYDHYGIKYIKANDLVESSGKKVTVTSDGLIVISNESVTDRRTLDALYTALQ